MKTKRICKSTVSLILAVMMLISMFTVGIFNSSAAETDVAETGATTRYYFGFTDWSSLRKAWFAVGSSGAELTESFKKHNSTISHDIGNGVGNQTYDVYYVDADSSYTDAYITVDDNGKSPETSKITLNSSKITLVTSWNNGENAYFGQTNYSTGGDTTETFPFSYIEGVNKLYLFTNGWTTPYCYAWTDGGSNNASWPGVAMTKTNETYDGKIVYEIDLGANATFKNVIFSNNGKNQTSDLTLDYSKFYSSSGPHDDLPIASITDPEYYLVGDWIDDWDSTDYPFNENNDYKVNLTLSGGTYKFKVYESTTDDEYCVASTYTVNDATTSAIQLYSKAADSSKASTVQLVATGGKYTFTFDPNTKKLAISHTPVETEAPTTIEPTETPSTSTKGKIYVGLKHSFGWFGIDAYCYDSNGTLIGDPVVLKAEGDPTKTSLTTVTSYVAAFDKNEPFYIFDCEIPETTAFIEFKVQHNSSTEWWWCEPLEGDKVTIEYHSMAEYDYEKHLFALYEYDTWGTDREQDRDVQGYKSQMYTHDEFTNNGEGGTIKPTEPTEPTEPPTTPVDPVLSAAFTDDHDGSTSQQNIVITPHAYLDGVEISDRASYTYDVYANGSLVQGATGIVGNNNYTLTLKDGVETKVHIVVHYDNDDATTSSKTYLYTTKVDTVTFNVGLKSSTSYRYIPYVSVNGKEAVEMIIRDENADYLRHNRNGTQSYYWHWASITIPANTDAKITFTNQYNKNGSTITLSADKIVAGKDYQFGYDNLNYSNTVYWLNDTELRNSPAIINFVETATHMISTDENSPERAQTRVNGTTYYMGDADGDGKLSIMDATAVQLALAKKADLSDVGTQIADYNLNNKLDVFDVTIIQKKLAN